MEKRRKPSQVKIFVKLFEFISVFIATVIMIISLLAMISQPDRKYKPENNHHQAS